MLQMYGCRAVFAHRPGSCNNMRLSCPRDTCVDRIRLGPPHGVFLVKYHKTRGWGQTSAILCPLLVRSGWCVRRSHIPANLCLHPGHWALSALHVRVDGTSLPPARLLLWTSAAVWFECRWGCCQRGSTLAMDSRSGTSKHCRASLMSGRSVDQLLVRLNLVERRHEFG